MLVRDVMIREVELLHPDDRLRDAAEKIRTLGLEPLPVWDGCKVVGMVTLSGIQQHAARIGLSAGFAPVSRAMSPRVVSCSEDQDLTEAAGLLAPEAGDDPLPGILVFDRSKRLVGVALAGDLRKDGTARKPAVTGAEGASQPKVDYDEDKVDYQSEESFPTSDPPPPPSSPSPSSEE